MQRRLLDAVVMVMGVCSDFICLFLVVCLTWSMIVVNVGARGYIGTTI